MNRMTKKMILLIRQRKIQINERKNIVFESEKFKDSLKPENFQSSYDDATVEKMKEADEARKKKSDSDDGNNDDEGRTPGEDALDRRNHDPHYLNHDDR